MKLIRGAAAMAVVALAGCKLGSSDLPSSINIGAIFMTDSLTPSGAHVLAPTATFSNESNLTLPDSRVPVDSCTSAPYPLTGADFLPSGALDAGASVSMQTDLGTTELTPDTTGSPPSVTYRLPADSAIPFTPGTSVTFAVPGATNGFPAMTVTAGTATTYAFSPIDTAPAADSFVVHWSPAAGTGTVLALTLAFSTNPDAIKPDQQILCSLVDDGVVQIPFALASLWRDATPGTRVIQSYKWVTGTNRQGGNAFFVRYRTFNNTATFQ